MRRFFALAFVSGLVTAGSLVTACAEEDITLATLPPTTDAGKPMERTRCVSDADCPSTTAFCARKTCADVGGFCLERPVICAGEVAPVCGCDGITYWNECLRRMAGVTAQTEGTCDELDTAQMCTFEIPYPGAPVTPAATCPGGTYCARLFPPSTGGAPDCPITARGTCWVLPTVCPADSDNERWTRCGDPEPSCHTTCDAIRSGDAYQHVTTCP